MKWDSPLILSLAKLRQNAEEILQTSELIICEDAYEITNIFCKNVLKIRDTLA
jgi:hypothetical protein